MSDTIQEEDKITAQRRRCREWYYNNHEEVLEIRKRYRALHKVERQMAWDAYYQKNKPRLLAYGKQYYKENKEKMLAYHREYYLRKKAEQAAQEKPKKIPKVKKIRTHYKRENYLKNLREEICPKGFIELPQSENPFVVTWD